LTATSDAVDAVPNADEPMQGEPVSEDNIVAGAKVRSRTNLLGDEPFEKLTATAPEEVM